MKSSRVVMAKALAGAAVLGALSLSGVASAAAGPASAAARGLLPGAGPEISVGAGVSTMVTVPDGSRAYVADADAPTVTPTTSPRAAWWPLCNCRGRPLDWREAAMAPAST
ncbi:hypothetical protein [Arthrobacter sp. A2-55]|uniref:hypothetical protein n=1 Tax=Arthrobacter sp. A2-55 TaxID=2897337 RepID=UPI0021CDB924|nr:hypothetical protein [Arthrobacter sp. A2-55]MCU6481147.1 hypothetical protein [Arthrobacter sp. A2-55]